MYDYNTIETYANRILENIKKARKNHKKANMTNIKFYANHIKDLAEQNLCFEINYRLWY